MMKDNLIQDIPSKFRDSKVLNAFMAAAGDELDPFKALLDDSNPDSISNQYFLDTATWGIPIHERTLGLLPNNTKTLEQRRAGAKAKRAMETPTTNPVMIKIIQAFVGNGNVEIVNYYADSSYDVILKTKSTFNNLSLAEVIDRINEAGPAHLGYQVLIDYLHDLVIYEAFERFFSELLSKCGTFLCEGDDWQATLGRSFSELVTDAFYRWFSQKMPVCSTELFSHYTDGRSFAEAISDSFYRYFSETLPVCSEEQLSHYTDGRAWKETLTTTQTSYFSSQIPRCSESFFPRQEVTA